MKQASYLAAMFVRKVVKKNPGSDKSYAYYRLVEAYRGAGDKPRQRVILNLGKLDGLPVEMHKTLADRIEYLLMGQIEIFSGATDPVVDRLAQGFYRAILQSGSHSHSIPAASPVPKPAGTFVKVDIDSIENEDIKEVGAAWLCKQVLDASGIGALLESVGVKGVALDHCMVALLARLVHPGSELATEGWLREHSALPELHGMRPDGVTRFHLYRAATRLYGHKELVERHLAGHARDLFSLDDRILLFDLTNTYFEGRMASSDKAVHGRSKEKRSDAPIVSLALVVDHLGFPKYSRFYPGNVSEPGTLAEVVADMSAHVAKGERKPVVVIDAGIATSNNLLMLTGKGYDYLCVSRTKPDGFDAATGTAAEFLSKQGHTISVKAVANPKNPGERILHVRSPLKAVKESAIRDKLTGRFLADMELARAAIGKPKGTKTTDKVHQRIGRIKERHSRVAKNYTIDVAEEKGTVTGITWTLAPKAPRDQEGVYFLRTSVADLSEEAVWRMYATLTEVEAAFRTLKTDLRIRPVHHQKDANIEAHLFMGVLAYHVVAILRHKLKQAGINKGWSKIVATMDSQKLVTTTFNDKDGNRHFVRQCSQPTVEAKVIYDSLGLKYQPFKRKKGVMTHTSNRTATSS